MSVRNHAESNDNLANDSRDQVGNPQLRPENYQTGVSTEAADRIRQSDTSAFALMQGLGSINANNVKSVDNIFGRNEEMTAPRLKLLVNVLELNREAPGKFGSDQGAFSPENLASIGGHLKLLAQNHKNPQAAAAMIAVADKYC